MRRILSKLKDAFRDVRGRLPASDPYVDLFTDPGHRPQQAVVLYHHLRRNGIHARYRVVGIGGGPGTPIGSVGQNLTVRVPRSEEPRARELAAGL